MATRIAITEIWAWPTPGRLRAFYPTGGLRSSISVRVPQMFVEPGDELGEVALPLLPSVTSTRFDVELCYAANFFAGLHKCFGLLDRDEFVGVAVDDKDRRLI